MFNSYEKFCDNFVLFQTVQHGFPNKPTCLAWDPVLRLMAIGTVSGAIKVYPLKHMLV